MPTNQLGGKKLQIANKTPTWKTKKQHNKIAKGQTKKTHGRTVITSKTKKIMKKINDLKLQDFTASSIFLDKKYNPSSLVQNNNKYIPGLTYRYLDESTNLDKQVYKYAIFVIGGLHGLWLPIRGHNSKANIQKNNIEEPILERQSTKNIYNELEPDLAIQEHNLDFLRKNINIVQTELTRLADDYNKNKIKKAVSTSYYSAILSFFRNNNLQSDKYENWAVDKRLDTQDNVPIRFKRKFNYRHNINKKYVTYLSKKILPDYLNHLASDNVLQNILTPSIITNISIIGAGPVGLCIAFVLASSNKFKVTIYEQRSTYTRDQYLAIDPFTITQPDLFAPIIDILLKEGNICHIDSPSSDPTGYCYTKEPRFFELNIVQIRISEFERLFRSHCIKKGVTFIEKTIKQPRDINEPYDILIGCDGGNSMTRDIMLGAKEIDDTRYNSYGIIINYKDATKTQYIKKETKKKTYELPASQYRYRFFRGKDRYTYLGLQLTKEEYDLVNKTANFGDIPEKIQNIFKNYWKLYKSKPTGFKKEETIDKVPVIPFKIKHVQYDKYADVVNNKLVVIAGDSVSQSHFFTGSGLGNGLATINNLLSYLVNKFDPGKYVIEYKFLANQYNISTASHITNYWESTRSGYNPTKLASKLCAKMTKEDWDNIKKRVVVLTRKDGGSESIESMKLDWFNDDTEMCKMFSRLVLSEYAHLA